MTVRRTMRWTPINTLVNVRLLVTESRVHWGERRDGEKASSPHEVCFPDEYGFTRVESCMGFSSTMQRASPGRCGPADDARNVAAHASVGKRDQRSSRGTGRAQAEQQSAGNHLDRGTNTRPTI